MAFVLDCSITMSWVFPDEATETTDRLRESMIEGRGYVPALWPVEVGNVLVIATRRGRITAVDCDRICAGLEALPIEIDPVSTSRAWGPALVLASKHRLSGYDATYLELAVRMQLPLATLDRALGAAGRAEGIDVLAGV